MKKLNKTGFTLIELLAVITIMGILMLVAIPAVSRTIENSRRDTFMNTAKSYLNAVKNAVAADEVKCGTEIISAKGAGYYYISFTTATGNTATDLMEQGGKSSWGNANVAGVIVFQKTINQNRNAYKYSVGMVDSVGRGIGEYAASTGLPTKLIAEESLSRTNVQTANGNNRSVYYSKNSGGTFNAIPTKNTTYIDDTKITSDFTKCEIIM